MDFGELKKLVQNGEDSLQQFKLDIRNPDSLAAEMVAFSNGDGGRIFIGVGDSGELPGVPRSEVGRLNQLISNAASQHIRSPISPITENVLVEDERVVIVVAIPKGLDKPYFDRNGIIWLKSGSDKRRLNSKEELRRLFQMSDQLHADEIPSQAGLEALDKLRFEEFLQSVYEMDFPSSAAARIRLLQNMNLAAPDGRLNLAGVLLFGKRPEWIAPAFVVKAVWFPGNEIDVSNYLDSEDITGPLSKMFENSLAFVMRGLHKVQGNQGVNTVGIPEIPKVALEELLANALLHRDYFVSAPIRLMLFADRVEIISPGHLPNTLTVEKIRLGNSIIRNPILVSHAAKGLLPYRGLGSGVPRALESWPDIEFVDDREGNQFKATAYRSPGRTDEAFLRRLKARPETTIAELAEFMGMTNRSAEKRIARLKKEGRIRRSGPSRGGRWEVIS
jgi:ATP-dependent DNA helicase RecG